MSFNMLKFQLLLTLILSCAICFGQNDHKGHNHQGHDHSGHNHEGHDHSGHNHDGHDHSGHNHSNHEGHNHQHDEKAKSHIKASKQGQHSGSKSQHKHHSSQKGHSTDHHGHGGCGAGHGHDFDPGQTAFHHIADANAYSIGPLHLPLPCIVYAPSKGLDFFSSSKFKFDRLGHGDGHQAYNGYVLDGGSVKRIVEAGFPEGEVAINGFVHKQEEIDGASKEISYACYKDKMWKLDAKSTMDAGLFGGGITSFYDFSITKNVVSMLLVLLFLSWLFLKVAKAYKTRAGLAPTGTQGFVEVMFSFIQDEVAKPFLGDKYMKYLPFLMAIFFFILGLNLFGQVPFFGGSNVSGNLAVTMVLAILAFLVTNLSGTKDYWKHIFWMPGVPAWVKTILTPVELLGVFIKPLTLMLRLFANITAGHMVVVIFVSLIFIFGKSGESPIGGWGAVIPAGLLTIFMMSIELLVAFIQAFVFTILTASYIGAAIESHDDHH